MGNDIGSGVLFKSGRISNGFDDITHYWHTLVGATEGTKTVLASVNSR